MSECEHCRHTNERVWPALMCCLLVAAAALGLYMAFILNYRWTSIEGDCIVEKRLFFERTESGDETDVVQRICPPTASKETG